jgi:hypothetical protein
MTSYSDEQTSPTVVLYNLFHNLADCWEVHLSSPLWALLPLENDKTKNDQFRELLPNIEPVFVVQN